MFENLVYQILVDQYVNHIKTQQMAKLYVYCLLSISPKAGT
jgi:hypothetical protein